MRFERETERGSKVVHKLFTINITTAATIILPSPSYPAQSSDWKAE